MARGKHKRSKQSKDTHAARMEIDRLTRELAVEQIKTDTAERNYAAYSSLVDEVSRARATMEAGTATTRTSLRKRTEVLTGFVDRITEKTDRAGKAWQKVFPTHARLHEGMEFMIYVISGEKISATDGPKSVPMDIRMKIDVARGERAALPPSTTEAEAEQMKDFVNRLLGSSDDEDDEEDEKDEEAIEEGSHTAARILAADGSNTHTPQSLALMYPSAWVDESAAYNGPTGDTGDLFGITAPAEATRALPEVRDTPSEVLTASLRSSVAAAGYSVTITAWAKWLKVRGDKVSVDHPSLGLYRDMPVMPTPRDAASIKHWYTLGALGAWGRDGKVGTGDLAVAMASSALFWLPPGQTTEYLDSEPLDANDLADLRLPYGSVALMFADPLVIDPVEHPTEEDAVSEEKLHWIDLGQRHIRSHSFHSGNLRKLGHFATQGLRGAPPSLDEAVRVRGARVEGVVLLAQDNGRLDDRFGWCITVPSHAGGVIGRWVLPARRSATVYADHINNLAAVAAWGKWISPSARQSQGVDIATGEGAAETLETGVHVLNMRGSSAIHRDESVPTGRTVAAHRRRGYWRRQHYGPGRAQTKMVRIAPTLVNPREGDLLATEQVYRMPRLL